jgi:8-hydroxy-5-deazaflavin:NADPH oxidoreductase
MKIGVLGTGPLGQAFAARLTELGHEVTIGTRHPDTTLARSGPGSFGTPAFREWREAHPQVQLGTFAHAAAYGEIVVNATLGSASLEALESAGKNALAGKVLLDVSNPLDFSGGMPLSLTVSNTDSLAEQIQRSLPSTRVVKALNTVYASLTVAPERLADGDHTVFVSGDDASAKATVIALLQSFGWRDVFDLGDLDSARGAEMMLPMWVRIFAVIQSPMFAFKLVRAKELVQQ